MKFQSRRLQLRDRYRRQKRSQKLFFYLSGFILFCLIFAFLVFAWFAKDLPAPGKLSQVSGASSVFYDRRFDKIFFLDNNILWDKEWFREVVQFCINNRKLVEFVIQFVF